MKHRRWCGGCGVLVKLGASSWRGGRRWKVSCGCRNVSWVGKQKAYKLRRRARLAA